MNVPLLLNVLILAAALAVGAYIAPVVIGQRIAARQALTLGLWAAAGSLALLYVLSTV